MNIFLLSDLKQCFKKTYDNLYSYIIHNEPIFIIDNDLKYDLESYEKINNVFGLENKKISLDFFRNYNFEKFSFVKNLFIIKKFKENSYRLRSKKCFEEFLINEKLLLDNRNYYGDYEKNISRLLKNSLDNIIKDDLILIQFVNEYCGDFKIMDFFIQDILVSDYFSDLIPYLNIYRVDSDFDLKQFLLYCRLNSVFFNVVKEDELEYSLISHLLKFNNDVMLFLDMLKNNVFTFSDGECYRNVICCKNDEDLIALNLKYNLPVDFLNFYKVYISLKSKPASLPIELLYYFAFPNNLVSDL